MNKRVLGIVLIIVGAYFLIVNPIGSIIFNYYAIDVDLPDYWIYWWINYGGLTLIIAIIGLFLVILGIRLLKKSKRTFLILKESDPIQ